MNVSVIIPVYNRRDQLLKAVESVKNQTYKASEIIVIDDGSTDGTSALFPIEGVIYKKIKHSGFPGAVRNRGVELAKSPYIAFLDSDDVWKETKLEKQVEYIIKNPECKILYTKEHWINNGKTVSQKKRKYKKSGDIFKESLQGCIIGPSTVVIEKSLFSSFNGFNENYEICEDYDLWLRICNSNHIHYLDEELIDKIAGHGDQLSFKYGFIEPFKIEVLENLLLNYSLTPRNREEGYEHILKKYEIIINGCIKRDKLQEAEHYKNRESKFKSLWRERWIQN